MKKIFRFLLFIFVVLAFSGCGGGGSSGSGKSATLAKANYENAQKVEEAIFSSEINSHSYRAREANNIEASKRPFVLNIAKEFIKLNNSNVRARVVEDACLSGSLDIATVNETTSSKRVLYRYSNCNDGVKVINGTVELYLGAKSGGLYYKQVIKFRDNYNVKYSSGPRVSIADGGVIDITITNYNSSSNYNFVLITTMKITQNSYSYGYDGMELHYIVSNNNTYWYETAGVIYINNYKNYVLWDNSYDMLNTPYRVDTNGYPITGEARYQMDGGILRIIADDGSLVLDIE